MMLSINVMLLTIFFSTVYVLIDLDDLVILIFLVQEIVSLVVIIQFYLQRSIIDFAIVSKNATVLSSRLLVAISVNCSTAPVFSTICRLQ